jgi:hypothetical protein
MVPNFIRSLNSVSIWALQIVFVFFALAIEGNGNVIFPLGILQRGFLFGLLLSRVQPLLCDDRKIGEYTRSVSRQQLGKHFPEAKNRRATVEVLLETRCFCWVRAEELS